MSKEAPLEMLQRDMFSGELADTRTRAQKEAARRRAQPQQQLMFSQRDIAQIGVNPHPMIPLSPHTKLRLISEDPRTEEEIERDRQRAAEALTGKLFPDEAALDSRDDAALENEGAGDEETDDTVASETEADNKFTAYLSLVSLTREQATTVWIDPTCRGQFMAQLPNAVLAAYNAGLSEAEIGSAIRVGEFLGGKDQQIALPHSTVVYEASANNHTPARPEIIGLRARLRRADVAVRVRR